MKNLYLAAIASVLFVTAQAQINWAVKGGLWAYDYGYGVVTDNSGNVYVAGKFEYNAVFGSYTANCQGNHDAYIAKYDNAGTIKWLRTAGGPAGDYAWGITTNGSSFFYISGEIEGTSPVIFQGSNITLTGKGDNDVFIAKYDMDGNLIWAKNEGVVTSEKSLGLTHDSNGNVYICGYFTDNTNFNNTPITGFGGRDIFIAKYDPNGNFLWMQKAGGTGRDEAKNIKCDNSGNVYVCGMFTGNASFGSGSVSSADSYQDSYVAKLSASDGTWQWVKKGNAILDDVAWSLAVDNGGSVYVTGEFNSFISFESSTQGIPTTGATNVYVAKLDGSGNVSWIKTAGGPVLDRARGIGTDGTNVYITGQFGTNSANAMAQFGSINLLAKDSSDIFVAGMDPSGNFTWAFSGDGPADTFEPLGYESGIAVTGGNGRVYATGGMLLDTLVSNCVSVDFAGTQLQGWRRTDMFLVSVGAGGVGVEEAELSSNFSVRPNPSNGSFAIDLGTLQGEYTLCTYNAIGQLICSKKLTAGSFNQLDLDTQPDGVYIAEIRSSKDIVSRKKLIVQH